MFPRPTEERPDGPELLRPRSSWTASPTSSFAAAAEGLATFAISGYSLGGAVAVRAAKLITDFLDA
ncbi:hypothetical protein ACQP1W_00520 [Spirillospora sp. CA-255316]